MKTRLTEITLTRNALLEWKKGAPINEIGIYDFHSNFLTMNEINSFHRIKFQDDDGTLKILKDRSWPKVFNVIELIPANKI